MDKLNVTKMIKKHAPEIINTENVLMNIEGMLLSTRKYLYETPEERERALYEELKKKYETES